MKGFLERYDSKRISGWADISAEHGDTAIQIRVDGAVVAEIVPSLLRADLEDRLVGFSVELPPGLAPSKACRLEAVGNNSKQHVGNSPLVVLLAGDDSRNSVLTGKDEYLFLSNDTNRVLDQISGRSPLKEDAAKAWRDFGGDVELLLNNGVDFRFLMIPNKECALEDKLPGNVCVTPDRPVLAVNKNFVEGSPSSFTRVFYPLRALQSDYFGQSFTKGDTHWTTFGAWAAVDAVFRDSYPRETSRISEEVLNGRRRDRFENADLLSKLGGDCVEPKPVCPLDASITKSFDNGGSNTGLRTSWVGKGLVHKRVLLVHDSFGPSMVPYLARLFGEVHTVWSPDVQREIVSEVRPDIIVLARVERFLPIPSRIL